MVFHFFIASVGCIHEGGDLICSGRKYKEDNGCYPEAKSALIDLHSIARIDTSAMRNGIGCLRQAFGASPKNPELNAARKQQLQC